MEEDKFLKDLNRVVFIDKISYYLAELNAIHPFREGNGRTIREFIRCLALYNNYNLDFTMVSNKNFIQASIISVSDYRIFINHIDKCLHEID